MFPIRQVVHPHRALPSLGEGLSRPSPIRESRMGEGEYKMNILFATQSEFAPFLSFSLAAAGLRCGGAMGKDLFSGPQLTSYVWRSPPSGGVQHSPVDGCGRGVFGTGWIQGLQNSLSQTRNTFA